MASTHAVCWCPHSIASGPSVSCRFPTLVAALHCICLLSVKVTVTFCTRSTKAMATPGGIFSAARASSIFEIPSVTAAAILSCLQVWRLFWSSSLCPQNGQAASAALFVMRAFYLPMLSHRCIIFEVRMDWL